MAEEKICGVCGKNPATRNCSDCGIPLCEECTKKVKLRTGDLSEQLAGYGITSGVSISTLRSGEVTKYLCTKCYKDLDMS
jgi:hypothetical protein